MIEIFKKILHKILPNVIDKRLREIRFRYQLKCAHFYHKNALLKVRKKEKVTVAFFIFKESVWKFEELYQLMVKDDRFEPIVVVCPFINYGEESMLNDMNQAFNYFVNNKYRVVKTYNEKSGSWLNVKKEIKPDVVFFSAPWYHTRPEYLIENYKKVLTCYVPYTFVISHLYQGYFNQYMQNYVWKFFLETEIHKKISLQYSRNKSVNTVVTGYPGMDKLLKKKYQPSDVWKIKDKKIKKIIWSPHHTIPGMGVTLDYSTFFTFHEVMFEIAKKYQNQIQFAFKPHPMLRSNLNIEKVWGKKKTDNYFQKWVDFPNGQLNEAEYIDLFATSDGMINDSSAFVIEYLYTGKPQLFLANDETVSERFNEVGKMAIAKHYQGMAKSDIEKFLDEIILEGNDYLENERIRFFNTTIKPPNNIAASENIYNYLKFEIFDIEN